MGKQNVQAEKVYLNSPLHLTVNNIVNIWNPFSLKEKYPVHKVNAI